ncbi:CocE/NonD family hydrolase [Streptomyces vinaceus]|uniref:CocE/NonD family hydrolase n=1 Tax=Streptomyces vinaceus TaxID=1960 RepID=UPI00382253C1
MHIARRTVVFTTAVASLLTATPAMAYAQQAQSTQPVHDFSKAIRETVFVTTDTDTDGDGLKDKVRVQVIRPDTPRKVPAIIEASPYHGGFAKADFHPADVTGTPRLAPWAPGEAARDVDQYPPYWDNYFVSRGYATLAVSTLGTGGSTGCPGTVSPEEVRAMTKVVEWLNGRAGATTAVDDSGTEARATGWSTGTAAMTGTSYKGTLALATATTGVRGLKTVVPMLPVSDWYDYYRANGGNVGPKGYPGNDADMHVKLVLTRDRPEACARAVTDVQARMGHENGDLNPFWRERDFRSRADRIRASVFVVAGLNDWNVRPKQSLDLWSQLQRSGVKSRLWLTQGQHDDPLDIRRQAWLDSVHKWFDQELMGLRSGADAEPRVQVQRPSGAWDAYSEWPARGAVDRTLKLASLHGPRARGWTDDPSRTGDQLATAPEGEDPARLAYLTEPLKEAVRISGTPRISVRAEVDGPSPYLSAFLVDYGPANYPVKLEAGQENWCFGDSAPGNTGCRPLKEFSREDKPFKIITRGWTDVRNRNSPAWQSHVEPGRAYAFRWDLEPAEHIVPAGHRIGIVLTSTDRDHTLRYPAGTRVTLDPAASAVTLPLASAR